VIIIGVGHNAATIAAFCVCHLCRDGKSSESSTRQHPNDQQSKCAKVSKNQRTITTKCYLDQVQTDGNVAADTHRTLHTLNKLQSISASYLHFSYQRKHLIMILYLFNYDRREQIRSVSQTGNNTM